MKTKPLVLFATLLFAIVSFYGCRSSKKITSNQRIDVSVDELFSNIYKQQFHYNTLSMKVSVSANINNQDIALSGSMRIIRDSIIWISLSPGLGIEAARFLITEDSLFFLNHISKQYAALSFQQLNNSFNIDVDFNILQSILTGNDFDYYDNTEFNTLHNGNQYKISMKNRSKQNCYIRNNEDKQRILLQDLWVNDGTFKIEAMDICSISDCQRKLHVEYANFMDVESQLFPKQEKLALFMQQSGKNHKAKLSFDYSRVELNGKITTPFTISEKYTPIVL